MKKCWSKNRHTEATLVGGCLERESAVLGLRSSLFLNISKMNSNKTDSLISVTYTASQSQMRYVIQSLRLIVAVHTQTLLLHLPLFTPQVQTVRIWFELHFAFSHTCSNMIFIGKLKCLSDASNFSFTIKFHRGRNLYLEWKRSVLFTLR